MEVTIEHSFCPYCDEAIELYFRIVNTILFSTHEDDLRAGMEHLKNQTLLDLSLIHISEPTRPY